MLNKAIFLDSDGVLNTAIIKDGKPVAPTTLAELQIPAEVKPALERLKAAGYLLICVTNKPDIERGLMTQATVDAIYGKIRHDLPLDDVLICYHENSDCYKPKPGLLLEAAKKYAIDLSQSYMIGDRWRDVGAGQNALCKTIWIDRGYAEQKPNPPADFTVHSLAEAAQTILNASANHKKNSATQINRRDHMANERTFLAWVRTSIGIMAFGFVVEKFSLFIKQIAAFLGATHLNTLSHTSPALQGYSSTIGIMLVALGALMGLAAFIRYRRVQQQIDNDDYQPSFLLIVCLTLLVCLMGLFLVVYLINST